MYREINSRVLAGRSEADIELGEDAGAMEFVFPSKLGLAAITHKRIRPASSRGDSRRMRRGDPDAPDTSSNFQKIDAPFRFYEHDETQRAGESLPLHRGAY
jgi:hypothetical protein